VTSRNTVLCVGQLVADVVVRPVNGLPVPGRADRVEDLQVLAGGCAANTASVLAKLGARVRAAGLIGTDLLGDLVLQEIGRCGVDVSSVTRSDQVSTSAVIVLVDGRGERSFLYRAGGNEQFALPSVPDGLFEGVGLVHVGGAMKLTNLDLVALLAAAKRAGCVTTLDTDWDASGKWFEFLGPALAHVDCLMTNEEEGRELTGKTGLDEMAEFLRKAGPPTVVIKRGPAGAVAANGHSLQEFGPYDVPVLDSTCAGDAFAAGLIYGLVEGWPLERAVRLGNATGGLATTQLSHWGVRSLSAALELMETAERKQG
jgi:sugar/nucleoside kinase (ribokinase family)